jgi:hypothetical protein
MRLIIGTYLCISELHTQQALGNSVNNLMARPTYQHPSYTMGHRNQENTHLDAANLCRDVIANMRQFQTLVTVNEFREQLLPIKVHAGNSYAIATASGDHSERLARSLLELQNSFHKAKAFLKTSMEHEELFDVSVEALTLLYQLDEMLQ